MLTPYVDVNFTVVTELSITCGTELIEMKSGDGRCRIVLFLTEDRKEAIRHIVRQWDLDDEAEARGETTVCEESGEIEAADPRCICGHYQDQHTDTGEASPLHQCLLLGCPCVAWRNQERPVAL